MHLDKKFDSLFWLQFLKFYEHSYLLKAGIMEGAIMKCVVSVQFPSFLFFRGRLNARRISSIVSFFPYILKLYLFNLFYLEFTCELCFREKFHNMLHKT